MIPQFQSKQLLFKWLHENKNLLIATKKATIKNADEVAYMPMASMDLTKEVEKAEEIPTDAKKIKARLIINTTKLMDSHDDVHIDQLWNKSIKETKYNYHVKEHNFSYEGIISDDVKVMAKQMSWAELGYDLPGYTQALVYDSVIDASDETGMFKRYLGGKVKNHSVGMRYVKIDMAINDDRYEKEFAIWEKYFPEIANFETAEEKGYFFAVTEAKNIEGSAVVRGSNYATPTFNVQETKDQPSLDTDNEPTKVTLNVDELLKHYQPKTNGTKRN